VSPHRLVWASRRRYLGAGLSSSVSVAFRSWFWGFLVCGSQCPRRVPHSFRCPAGLGGCFPRRGWVAVALAGVCCRCSVAAVDRPALTFTPVGFRLGGWWWFAPFVRLPPLAGFRLRFRCLALCASPPACLTCCPSRLSPPPFTCTYYSL
jgi:hypothetical protein